MSQDWISYRIGLSPPWFRNNSDGTVGAGTQWGVGFGSEENAVQTQLTQCVEVRFPDYAPPVDTPTASVPYTALGLLQHDRALGAVYVGQNIGPTWAVGQTPVAGSVCTLAGGAFVCVAAGGAAALPGPAGPGQSVDGGGNVWQAFQPTIQYLKSGFSQGTPGQASAAGLTRSWLPGLAVVAGVDVVGGAGLAWACTTSGVTGGSNPFDLSVAFSTSGTLAVKDAGDDVGVAVLTAARAGSSVGLVVTEPTGAAWTSVGLLSDNSGTAGPTYQVVGPPQASGSPASQSCPNAPGWYWAGTDQGLVDALVSAGLFAVTSAGALVPPRIYRNRDFVQNAPATSGFLAAQLVGASLASVALTVTWSTSVGQVSFAPAVVAAWSAGMTAAPGSFVQSAHGDIFWTVDGGVAGLSNPFPSATPTPGSWPAAPAYADGAILWSYATLVWTQPTVPISPTLGLTASGTNRTGFDVSVDVSFTPSPPDGNTAAWARVWLALPVGNLTTPPTTWGFAHTAGAGTLIASVVDLGAWPDPVSVRLTPTAGHATTEVDVTVTDLTTGVVLNGGPVTGQAVSGPYTDAATGLVLDFTGAPATGDSYLLAWLWGGPQPGQLVPTLWGQGNGVPVYNLVLALSSRWLPAHDLLVGTWLCPNADTTLDAIPVGLWNESIQATFGGVTAPFSRYNPVITQDS
jgi:hypothetical protein